MAIVKGLDTNETFYTVGVGASHMLYGLYYYYLDNSLITNNKKLSWVLQLPSIQTLSFLPFFNSNEISSVESDIDKTYFKLGEGFDNVKVYRSTVGRFKKELPSYNIQYDILQKIEYDEPLSLAFYPYSYYLLSDGINPPLMIKPQDLNSNTITPIVETYITQNSKYKIYVKESKNDNNGELEGIINNTPLLLPIGTNVYNNFMVTGGNTFQATNSLAMLENDKTLNQGNRSIELNETSNNVSGALGLVGGLGSLLSGNIGNGLTSLANTGSNYYMNSKTNDNNRLNMNEDYKFKNYQIDTMKLATQRDYLNTPRTMKTLGNDGLFSLNNTNGKLKLYKFGLNSYNSDLIKQYYKRYGYRINKYGKPKYWSHKYYNFIKTSNCNIDSARIPIEHIQELQQIFDSGITFWNVMNGAIIGDYSVKNEYVRDGI